MGLTPLYHAKLVDKSRGPHGLWRESFPFEIKQVDDEKRTVTFVGSTEDVDRSGDVILVNGWKLTNFRKNPKILWAHKYDEPWIGEARDVRRTEKGLEFDVEFTPADVNPFGDLVFRLVKWSKSAATSVGFIPLDFGPRETDETDGVPEWRKPKLFKKQELLELSIVPVPDNPNAIGQAKSAGVISEDEEAAILKAIGQAKEEGPSADHGALTMAADIVIPDGTACARIKFAEPDADCLAEKISKLASSGLEEDEIRAQLREMLEPDGVAKSDIEGAIRVIRSVEKGLTGLVSELASKLTLIDDRLEEIACEMREAGIDVKEREKEQGDGATRGDPAALAKLRLRSNAMEIERLVKG